VSGGNWKREIGKWGLALAVFARLAVFIGDGSEILRFAQDDNSR
jgi:hypothetical protein